MESEFRRNRVWDGDSLHQLFVLTKLLTLCVPLDVIHSSTALHAHLSCARVGLGDIYDPFVF